MTRWLPYVLAALILLAIGNGIGRSCRSPTKVEQRVDTVLAEAPAWRDSVKARDAELLKREKDRKEAQIARAWQRHRADSLEALAKRLQAQADTQAQIPSGTASDSVRSLQWALQAQQRASAGLRVLVDSLKAGAQADSLQLAAADRTILRQKEMLGDAYNRVDVLTNNLAALRKETKHKGDLNLLGIHLPGWTKTAVLVAGAGYVGYRVGKGD